MKLYEKFGYIKVAATTPDIRVADCDYNTEQIKQCIDNAAAENVKIAVFPELCVTGYTCQDLFWQTTLINAAKKAVMDIAAYTKDKDILVFVGAPMEVTGKLYNTAVAMFDGEILGIVPKTNLPNYGEFYELRHFASGAGIQTYIELGEFSVLFGANQIFSCEIAGHKVGVAAEIC